jgi:hypothetical protein
VALTKLLGPVQLQVTDIVLLVVAVRFKGLPEHTGVFDDAVGFAGVESTTTLTVPDVEVQLLMVTVTL